MLPVVALIVLSDLWVRRNVLVSWDLAEWLIFLGSCLVSWGFWQGAFLLSASLMRRQKRRHACAFVASWSAFWSWIVISTLVYFIEWRSFPVSTAVHYILEEPESTLRLALPFFTDPLNIACLLTVPVVVGGWWWFLLKHMQSTAPPETPMSRVRRLVPALAVLVVVVLLFAKPARYAFLLPDAHAGAQVSNVISQLLFSTRDRLHAPHRTPIPKATARADRPNILFLLHESLGPRAMSLYGSKDPTTPQLDAFVREVGDDAVVFQNAQSNSGFTLISVVSALTGLSPDRSSVDFHTAPVLWDYAHAAGYETFLFTAQSYSWGHMDAFFFSERLHTIHTAETSGLPRVNDVGVDDVKITDAAVDFLRTRHARKDRTKPFFGVLHYHGTHFPFLKPPASHKTPDWKHLHDEKDRAYYDSVHLIDAQQGRVLDLLREQGLLDNTIIVMTSDHGANLRGDPHKHGRLRMENHYDEIMRVPYIVYIPPNAPETLRKARDVARTNAASKARISNLDTLPTLLDAMLIQDPAIRTIAETHDGHSLLQPLPSARTHVYTNYTDFRGSYRQGFALVRGDEKYLFFTPEKGCDEELYNLRKDPAETQSLWTTLDDDAQKMWYAEIARRPWLYNIRMRPEACPPRQDLFPPQP